MKQADLPELKRRVLDIARVSSLGERVRGVDVEADDDGEGGTFLRISFQMDGTDDLEWDKVEPLVRAIEDDLESVDERFPSVRFADAA